MLNSCVDCAKDLQRGILQIGMHSIGSSSSIIHDYFWTYYGTFCVILFRLSPFLSFFCYFALIYRSNLKFSHCGCSCCLFQILGIAYGINLLTSVDLWACICLAAVGAVFLPFITLLVSFVLNLLSINSLMLKRHERNLKRTNTAGGTGEKVEWRNIHKHSRVFFAILCTWCTN